MERSIGPTVVDYQVVLNLFADAPEKIDSVHNTMKALCQTEFY